MRKIVLLAVAMVFVAGCGIKKDVYQRDVNGLKGQIAALEGDKASLVSQKAALNGEIEKLNKELEALAQEKGVLSKGLKDALDKVEELRRQAEIRRARLAELRNKLQSMVAAGQLTIRTSGGRMIVEMAEMVLFESGKFRLKEDGRVALTELTAILQTLEGRHFQVAGHTDSAGSDEMNWKLSLDRAREVVLHMVDSGMPPTRVSAAGYGKFAPVASNDTPEGMAQNRRIEIVLVPDISELLSFDDEPEAQ
ncbi:MAG: OmpA family protein [Myxococcota bacterium]|jgi:chemotaxis protein MotB|nr:OmpA family protein [Myxococcota bacterium]OQC42997.1 MAG: putative lipoprotein YiaD precursor [Deltaproteobacteria bacterium ADurb.Bin058]HHW97294.1 OmpA family protein [Oligoflexales bacterium]HQC43692.1 OmpA family protein [Myxococcota bacterium]